MSKEKFDKKLITLLESNLDFVDEVGELHRANIRERAWKLDQDLIKLLLTDKEVEVKFFKEIEGRWIFDNNTFVDYITDKNFFADSYTKFRNKIGLNIDGKFLSERGEVALVWPYKDCVLEGGQTREEEKRKEIFFNEILAPDEINRMFDPKVLTNWKRHTANGEQDVTDIQRDENGTIRENLIIKGNNLIALHSLKEQFRGKVKFIYIDPPYNTGSDSFGYNDSFNHSSWLTFMRNRLYVTKELLRSDGVIVVQCDDNEQSYLKVLMDEVFGRQNFVSNSVVVINRGGRDYGGIARTHEYLLVYSKEPQTALNQIEEKHKNFDYEDELGGFNLMELRNRNILFNAQNRPNLFYPFYVNPVDEDTSGLLEISLESKQDFVEVIPLKSQGVQTVWRWGKARAREYLNTEIKGKAKRDGGFMIVQKHRSASKRQRSVWDEKEFVNERGTEHIKALFGRKVFDYPKSEYLIARIIELGSDIGDIVLDFHLGSGTTATAAHKMGRQYIGIEQMDYITGATVPRLNKVITGEQGGISESVNWKGGGNFIYCEMMKYNEVFMERIQLAQSSEALLSIWHDMSKDSVLNWYVKPDKPEEAEENFTAINNVEKQKQLLAELLDKNQLYVHLSEIEDETFAVSEADKALNRAFYGDSD
ncbi:MAG: site-specific DNA-methyltransferase [Candidatus Poribacteria bacterium]|nr:site-specific DNA-methyltransferase [Candidatus Poribacteria bacterium]